MSFMSWSVIEAAQLHAGIILIISCVTCILLLHNCKRFRPIDYCSVFGF